MKTVLGLMCLGVLLPASLVVAYQWMLAIISLCAREPKKSAGQRRRANFVILIPAHNEESGLPRILESLKAVQYPKALVQIVVVADRCDDDTVAVARRSGSQCLERLSGPSGKGAAIAWAIDELRGAHVSFDALLIIDADTVVEPGALEAFDDGLASGAHVQQGYCYISNPWETPFTRIIAVTSVLRNRFFYGGKRVVGLSGMLAGTGMCFSRPIIQRYGWPALSVGEDWEFSASLLLAGEKIHFNPLARVFQLESSGFRQASGQRLRWAGGRHAVAASSAWKLFRAGLQRQSLYLFDAGLTLVAPNYSSQATLAIGALLAARAVSVDPAWQFLGIWAELLVGSLASYFLLGTAFTAAPLRTLSGIALIPVFLPWRLTIEILGFLGYGRKQWIRTPRTPTSTSNT